MSRRKLLKRLADGSRNVRFGEFVALIEAFGFRRSRTSGSHHIFVHSTVPELINIQNVDGQAKPYRINQFLRLVERHNPRLEDDR